MKEKLGMSNPVPYSPVFSWDQTRYRGCSHMDSVANVQQFCDKVDRSVKSLSSVLGIYLDCRCITITSTNFFFFFLVIKVAFWFSLCLLFPYLSPNSKGWKRGSYYLALFKFNAKWPTLVMGTCTVFQFTPSRQLGKNMTSKKLQLWNDSQLTISLCPWWLTQLWKHLTATSQSIFLHLVHKPLQSKCTPMFYQNGKNTKKESEVTLFRIFVNFS